MTERLGHSLAEAKQMDSADPLRHLKSKFNLAEGVIFMDGNSLGAASKPARASVIQTLDDWESYQVSGWTDGERPWYYMAEQLAEIEAPLIGARPNEVIVANSTTVNIHQHLATFYWPDNTRKAIIVDEYIFPSDARAINSWFRHRSVDRQENLLTVNAVDRVFREEDVIKKMDEYAGRVAMLVLPSVVYTTGQLLDMQRLTQEAHDRGILALWDLSHSMGSVPHKLHDWDVDLAVWGNYKYMNSAPGAEAGLFVHENHLSTIPGLDGWFSSDKEEQFDMSSESPYASGAGKYQIGTPHVLSASPLFGSLDIINEAGIDRIRTKSLKLTKYMRELADAQLTQHGISIVTPQEDERRGGHLALVHPNATQICKALKARGVLPDFRPPDIVRLAPVALYNTYEDVYATVEVLRGIMETQEYLQFPAGRGVVA